MTTIVGEELKTDPKERLRKLGWRHGIEIWWCLRQTWLKGNGYMLRPRFRQDWVPSWVESDKKWFKREDAQYLSV